MRRHMEAVIAEKEAEKAEASQQLADTMQELDDVTKQMEADIEFFDQTKAACKAKYEEWTERSNARMEELEGIKEALKILTSDEARALFAKAIKPGTETFLQLDSNEDESAPQMKAYNVLKEDGGLLAEFPNLLLEIANAALVLRRRLPRSNLSL